VAELYEAIGYYEYLIEEVKAKIKETPKHLTGMSYRRQKSLSDYYQVGNV
jgi:hypothetical protein